MGVVQSRQHVACIGLWSAVCLLVTLVTRSLAVHILRTSPEHRPRLPRPILCQQGFVYGVWKVRLAPAELHFRGFFIAEYLRAQTGFWAVNGFVDRVREGRSLIKRNIDVITVKCSVTSLKKSRWKSLPMALISGLLVRSDTLYLWMGC